MKMKNEKKLISKMGSSVCLFQVQKVLSHISAISPEKKIFFRVFLDF